MADQGQVIFKRVGISDKKMLFRELVTEKVQVVLKSDDDEIFHLIAIQFERDENLLCHHTDDSKKFEKPESESVQKVVANFLFRGDRYFFQTELSFNSGWAVLKTDGDLFQLQRRANSRVDLPEKYNGVFILHQHSGKKYFVENRIKDISAGGLKLEMAGSAPNLKIGDTMKGTVRLGVRRPIEFELEVRFTQVLESGVQVAGVQFMDVDQTMENRLLSLMMDLQRELYVKFAGTGR